MIMFSFILLIYYYKKINSISSLLHINNVGIIKKLISQKYFISIIKQANLYNTIIKLSLNKI